MSEEKARRAYFSHDADATSDPAICDLLMDYGNEGYGVWWRLIETLRKQPDYRFPMRSLKGLGYQFQFTGLEEMVQKCVDEYGLLSSDGVVVWSKSLDRRMAMMREKSEKARKAGKASAAARKKSSASNGSSTPDEQPKKTKPKKQAKAEPSGHAEIRALYFDLHTETQGFKPQWGAAEGDLLNRDLKQYGAEALEGAVRSFFRAEVPSVEQYIADKNHEYKLFHTQIPSILTNAGRRKQKQRANRCPECGSQGYAGGYCRSCGYENYQEAKSA